MNQQCKVCGEPAAGFHFGAFTCEGCKSFFGRSYNNLSSISECKNGGECVINKKNRTACKACRLRKCLLVGMSKSGSRYGRRSNWFKIHCLLQEQQQQQQQQVQQRHSHHHHHHHHHHPLHRLHHPQHDSRQRSSPPAGGAVERRGKEESRLDEYKNSISPSVSSPESHNSDGSVEISERRAAYALHPGFRPLHPVYARGNDLSTLGKEMMNLGFHLGGVPILPPILPPPGLTVFSPYLYGAAAAAAAAAATSQHPLSAIATSTTSPAGSPRSAIPNATLCDAIDKNSNIDDDDEDTDNYRDDLAASNNNRNARNHNIRETRSEKRFYLDAILESQQTSPRLPGGARVQPPQEDPIDLSLRTYCIDNTLDDDHDDVLPPSKRRPVDLTSRS